MAKMLRTAKFCTYVLHMEGEEVFGSQSANLTCRLETNRIHSSQIESILFVNKLKQGLLELKLLVILLPTYKRSIFPIPR
jgi:hypothetical protein